MLSVWVAEQKQQQEKLHTPHKVLSPSTTKAQASYTWYSCAEWKDLKEQNKKKHKTYTNNNKSC